MRTAPGPCTGRRIQPAADRREADDFAFKTEHDKRARMFIDPAATCWSAPAPDGYQPSMPGGLCAYRAARPDSPRSEALGVPLAANLGSSQTMPPQRAA